MRLECTGFSVCMMYRRISEVFGIKGMWGGEEVEGRVEGGLLLFSKQVHNSICLQSAKTSRTGFQSEWGKGII